MTNTLHRKGSADDLQTDFVVFALPKVDMFPLELLIEKLKRFSEICLRHNPINMGKLNGLSLSRIDPRHVQEEMKDKIGLTATFNSIDSVALLIRDLKEADLGISINISGLLEAVDSCCHKAGMKRHSVEQSVGIFGKKERLPTCEIVEINTLCGHGLVSFNLIRKVVGEVKLERMTPEQGALHLAKPCECGVFNTHRAKVVLERLRLLG